MRTAGFPPGAAPPRRRNPTGTGFVSYPHHFPRRFPMGELADKIKGNVNEALGKAKQRSGDPATRDEGAGQELKGKFQEAKGAIKGAINKL
jgi:uncharacterized protein YjbJ (UPF0337 family)